MVGLLGIERAQARVEGRIVPHVEELCRAVFRVGVKVVHRRAERALELFEIAIDRHLVGRCR